MSVLTRNSNKMKVPNFELIYFEIGSYSFRNLYFHVFWTKRKLNSATVDTTG